jgi:hypothetical protein
MGGRVPGGASVPLSDGTFAAVDEEDREWLSQHRWTISASGGPFRWTGGRAPKRHAVWMHREILGLPRRPHPEDRRRGKHLNGDPRDNRRFNLAVVSPSQDRQNTSRGKPHGGPATKHGSRYIGVVRTNAGGSRWAARMKADGQRVHLGTFGSEEEAALAYDRAARAHYGTEARTNFPADGQKAVEEGRESRSAKGEKE